MSNIEEKKEFINKLYGLMMEANLNRSDEEVLSEIDLKTDIYIIQSMSFIRQLNTKAKAQLSRARFNNAQQMLEDLITKAGGSIDSFIEQFFSKPDKEQVMALFKDFKTLSESDKKSILLDNKILEIISKAKKDIDLSSNE